MIMARDYQDKPVYMHWEPGSKYKNATVPGIIRKFTNVLIMLKPAR